MFNLKKARLGLIRTTRVLSTLFITYIQQLKGLVTVSGENCHQLKSVYIKLHVTVTFVILVKYPARRTKHTVSNKKGPNTLYRISELKKNVYKKYVNKPQNVFFNLIKIVTNIMNTSISEKDDQVQSHQSNLSLIENWLDLSRHGSAGTNVHSQCRRVTQIQLKTAMTEGPWGSTHGHRRSNSTQGQGDVGRRTPD